MFLTTSVRGHLRVLGVNPCAGVPYTWIPDGDCPGNLSLGQHAGDGKSDGETFWVGRGCFFLGGWGGRKRKRQDTVSSVGRWTTLAFKQPHFVIYYMLSIGGFTAACLQTITKGVLDPRLPYVVMCYMSVICYMSVMGSGSRDVDAWRSNGCTSIQVVIKTHS